MDTLTLLGGRATTREALGLATTDSPTLANLTLSGGTLTGGASGVTVAAGGTNQKIKLLASGSAQVEVGVTDSSNGILRVNGGVWSTGGTGFQTRDITGDNLASWLRLDGSLYFASGSIMAWGASATDASAARDLSLSRLDPGSIGLGTGAAGSTAGSLSLATLTAGAAGTSGAVNVINGGAGSTQIQLGGASGLNLGSGMAVIWDANANLSGTPVTAINQASAGVLEINNNTPGTLRSLSLLNLTASGQVIAGDGTVSAPAFRGGDSDSGFFFSGNNIRVAMDGGTLFNFDGGGGSFNSSAYLGWTSGSSGATGRDTTLNRLGIGHLAVGTANGGSSDGSLSLLNLTATAGVGCGSATIGTLPITAGTGRFVGARWLVTDALTPAWNAAVAAGGAVKVHVWWDGTDWICE